MARFNPISPPKKKLLLNALLIAVLLFPIVSYSDIGFVVKRFGGCDYFFADGPRGLYVLEWYGGYDPDEGDKIYGDIGSYGFKDVYYPDQDREGRVWVEDFLESVSGALDEIKDRCL